MTDHKINLPPSLLAALYENVLVDPNPRSAAAPAPAKKTMKKNTVVVCFSPEDFIAPEQEAFLESILSACKLKKEDVALLSSKNPMAVDHKTILEAHAPASVLLFGLKPSDIQLPVHFPEFQIQTLYNTKFMCAPALEIIQSDKPLKVQLWKTLQQLYQL